MGRVRTSVGPGPTPFDGKQVTADGDGRAPALPTQALDIAYLRSSLRPSKSSLLTIRVQ